MAVQERGIRTRNELIRAAAIVFDAHGFTGGSTSMILKATDGVVQGSLYFHFPTKRHIASAVMDEATQQVRGAFEVIRTHAASPLDALIDFSAQYCRLLADDVMVRAGFRLALEPSALSDEGSKAVEALLADVKSVAAHAAEEGEITSKQIAERLASVLSAAFVGVQHLDQALSARAQTSALLADTWRLLLPAVAPAERVEGYVAKVDAALGS